MTYIRLIYSSLCFYPVKRFSFQETIIHLYIYIYGLMFFRLFEIPKKKDIFYAFFEDGAHEYVIHRLMAKIGRHSISDQIKKLCI